jgi:predicted Zn-dependent protease
MRNKILLSHDALDLARGARSEVVSELQTYLGRFGWLRLRDEPSAPGVRDDLPEAESGYFDEATEQALVGFQRFYGLPATGTLNDQTLALMRRPRCGVPDNSTGGPRDPAAFLASGKSWQRQRVTYRLARNTADLSALDVKAALAGAARRWSLVTPLVVREQLQTSDIVQIGAIEVRFETGNHGDSKPFDGVGNVLAHAFFPPGTTEAALDGDIHFDDDETWARTLPSAGTDLDAVALHEMGHSIGLDHTAVSTAVMWPFNNGLRELTQDDIDGIRSIYGTRERTIWALIHAAVEGEGRYVNFGYFFRFNRYIRYNYLDDLPDVGYPRSVTESWQGVPMDFVYPRGLDAAVNGQGPFAGKLYLFSGDRYLSYDWANERVDDSYPRPIQGQWPGFPPNFCFNLDCAVTGRGPYVGKAYFFKGDQYIRYDWTANTVDLSPTTIAGSWPGLPADFTTDLQAAMNGRGAYEGKLYFFKGNRYVRYDWREDRTDFGPLPIEYYWL